MRVYDKVAEIQEKSGKVWFYDLWGTDRDVWLIEWQVRKDCLRRFSIVTVQDLYDQVGDLVRYLSGEHDSLRLPTSDSNRSRWDLHPLWIDLQARAQKLNAEGV